VAAKEPVQRPWVVTESLAFPADFAGQYLGELFDEGLGAGR